MMQYDPALDQSRICARLAALGRLCVVALLSGSAALAADWYVDNTATGANSGKSWADAWNNPTNITWPGVQPGDTVYVSGGTTNQIYKDWLIIPKDGTPGNYITVRIGQDAGHNGVAIFDGCGISLRSQAQWNAIDGGRSAVFIAPANHDQVIHGPTAITNNIGFRIRNIVSTNRDAAVNDPDAFPQLWHLNAPENLRFSYIEVSGLTNASNYGSDSYKGGWVCNGNASGAAVTNVVFEYLYLNHNYGGLFLWYGQAAAGFDGIVWKFGWIDLNTEDNFQVGSGWTIRDSVIGPVDGRSFHTDIFQITGSFWKIYNNDIRESQNSIMRLQTWPNMVTHDMWFFNNLVTEKPGRAPKGGTCVEPFCMVHFDPDHPGLWTTYSNIVFANNLFYNSIPNNNQVPPEMCRNPVMFWNRGAVTNSFIEHCLFVNNLVIDKESGACFPVTTNLSAAGYVPFTTNDFVVNYNTFAATNRALHTPLRVAYLDVVTNAGSGPYAFKNTTTYPAFADKANDNFELLPTDAAALNTGMDLSSYFNFDSLNRPRNVGGAWDRGPLEFQGSGPANAPAAPLRQATPR